MSAPFHPGGLVELLRHAYDHSSWHGANLREALEGVSLEEVLWRIYHAGQIRLLLTLRQAAV